MWENTLEDSPLRRFLVDLCVWFTEPEAFEPEKMVCEKEVCLDILRGFCKRVNEPGMVNPLMDPCNYYIYRDGGNETADEKQCESEKEKLKVEAEA